MDFSKCKYSVEEAKEIVDAMVKGIFTVETALAKIEVLKEGKVEETDDYEKVEFNDLDTYLKSKPENTVDTSYKIKVINIPESGAKSSLTSGTLGNILGSNKTKYVSLQFDNSLNNVTDARNMFQGCRSLTSIDTTPFTNVTNAQYMFSDCSLTAYYSSEDDKLYANYRNNVSGNVTWIKKTV